LRLLTLLPEDVAHWEYPLREVFNGLCNVVKTGAPWTAAYQQVQHWLMKSCFEALAEDLRTVLRLAAGRQAQASAAIVDTRTLRSTPESDEQAGYDGAKRKKGSKQYLAVDHAGPPASGAWRKTTIATPAPSPISTSSPSPPSCSSRPLNWPQIHNNLWIPRPLPCRR